MSRVGHDLVFPSSLQTFFLVSQYAQSDVLGSLAGIRPDEKQFYDESDGDW